MMRAMRGEIPRRLRQRDNVFEAIDIPVTS